MNARNVPFIVDYPLSPNTYIHIIKKDITKLL